MTDQNHGGPRNAAGRPRNIEELAHIHVKVDRSEKGRFVQSARRGGQTLSEWVLGACRERQAANLADKNKTET